MGVWRVERVGRRRGERTIEDVAHHGEFAATTESIAGDGGKYWRSEGRQVRPRGDEVVDVCVREGQRLHLFYICAGCEGLVATREDYCAHIFVFFKRLQGGIQLLE